MQSMDDANRVLREYQAYHKARFRARQEMVRTMAEKKEKAKEKRPLRTPSPQRRWRRREAKENIFPIVEYASNVPT